MCPPFIYVSSLYICVLPVIALKQFVICWVVSWAQGTDLAGTSAQLPTLHGGPALMGQQPAWGDGFAQYGDGFVQLMTVLCNQKLVK